MTNSELKKKIMRRVYTRYVMRQLLSSLALKAYIFVLLFAGVAALVSVSNVFKNMPQLSDVGGVLYFSLAAFLNTEMLVQALVVGMVIFLAILARDVATGIRLPAVGSHA